MQQMTSDRFPSDIEPFLVHDVGNISRLAVVLLAEQKLGQVSIPEIYPKLIKSR